ncbi:MAG: cytochrome c3 family protein [Thermoguttaceae bacterium]
MQVHRHWQRLLGLLILLAGLGGLTAVLMGADEHPAEGASDASPKVIAPPNCAVMLSGNFDVIYRGSEAALAVDSRPVPWEDAYVDPIHVGRVRLNPGMHQVQIGDRKVQLCVALNEMEHEGPADWPIHRIHTMSAEKDRCAECHDTQSRESRFVVGDVMVPDSCMTCHADKEVKEVHQELVQPLPVCSTCHILHGSPNPSLLRAPAGEIRRQYGAPK